MSSTWGNSIKISIFGESHGLGVGVVLDGLPSGEPLDIDALRAEMERRAPLKEDGTSRREADMPEICSGLLQNTTTGAPLCAVIENAASRTVDYERLSRLPRPGSADYTGAVRYNGYNDVRGGGHFSGRLTAPLVFAGAVCRQILARRGVTIGGHILAIGNVFDHAFDLMRIYPERLIEMDKRYFALLDPECEPQMRAAIENARADGDSIGGIVEAAAVGVPAGVGTPIFGGVENVLSSIIYGVPAIKGVEFGAGFNVARMRGSECNDPFAIEREKVVTATNNCGGILGGITTGMPIVVRAAVKPTPSIPLRQHTVDLKERRDALLSINGKHDPCLVPRALPSVEAAMAIGIADMMKEVGRL